MRSFSFWQRVCGYGELPWMIATLRTSPSALGANKLPPRATSITTTAGSTRSRQQLMEAACLKFNLTPMEAEYLARSLKEIS